MAPTVNNILVAASDATLGPTLLHSFQEVEKHFFLRSWKTSQLDAGHFVEAVRRLVELKLFGSYAPIGQPLPNFNPTCLTSYENAVGNESYRILIPRLLYAAYCIRNKRGVGHLGSLTANYLDATFIVASCKWVLAEIIRLESKLPPDVTAEMVEKIVERPIPSVWNGAGFQRVLLDVGVREQVLILLLTSSPRMDKELRSATDCKNDTYFRKILRTLHNERLIEYAADGKCTISPKGVIEAEQVTWGAATK